jgi:hypothetical protein
MKFRRLAPTELTHSADHDILHAVATWEADIWLASRFLVRVHPFWINQVLRDRKTQYIESAMVQVERRLCVVGKRELGSSDMACR